MAEDSSGTMADALKPYDYDDPHGAEVKPRPRAEAKPAQTLPFPEPKDPALEDALPQDGAKPSSGDGFDEDLVIAAANLGFDETEARAFGTPDNLRKAMRVMEGRMKDFAADAERARQATQPAELRQEPADFEEPKFAELDPDDYGELNEALKSRDEYLLKTAKAAQDRIKRLEDQLMQNQAQAVEQQFDTAIEKLCEDDPHFRTVYGKGSTLKLPDGGLHQKNRHEVVKRIKQWSDAAYRDGGAPDSLDKMVYGAAKYLHGLSPQEAARRDLEGKLTKQQGQVGHPPTEHTGNDKPRGRDRAVAGLTELMKSKGWGPFGM